MCRIRSTMAISGWEPRTPISMLGCAIFIPFGRGPENDFAATLNSGVRGWAEIDAVRLHTPHRVENVQYFFHQPSHTAGSMVATMAPWR